MGQRKGTVKKSYTDRSGVVVTGDAAFVEAWADRDRANALAEAKKVRELRAEGYKAWHYWDGWVDKENLTVTFPSYVHFNDYPEVGDLIMLGSRTCRVVELIKPPLRPQWEVITTYRFEILEPERPKQQEAKAWGEKLKEFWGKIKNSRS